VSKKMVHSHSFSLTNLTLSNLTFRVLSLSEPLMVLMNNEEVYSTLKPRETIEGSLRICLTHEAFMTLVKDESAAEDLVMLNDSLVVEYSNSIKQEFPISVRVSLPSLSAYPSHINYSTCLIGHSSLSSFQLRNTSHSSLKWNITLPEKLSRVIQLEPNSNVLDTGSETVRVTFTPRAEIKYSIELLITEEITGKSFTITTLSDRLSSVLLAKERSGYPAMPSFTVRSCTIGKIWSCVYKRCWDVESNVSSDQSNWRGYFLETATHWLLNKLTLIHSCTSKDCRGSKFDYVLRVLFGCGSPFENSSATSSATSTLYGLHVICGHCKLVIPNYRRNEYDILIDLLEEERLVRLAQNIIDEFMYRPQSIKIILGRSHLSRLYSKFNQYRIDRLGAFLCEVEHATFKHATETSDPVVSKIVQCICSKEHKTKKVKMTLVNSNHNSDSWNATLQNFTQDIILEIVCS
uniref:Uncharacterized protein n=1 Tax=Amphimedon queenslandica TaxID=400682 RepID=A0A1X7T1R4_AMPQE